MRRPAFRVLLCWIAALGLAGALRAGEAAPVSSHEAAARDLYQLLGGAKAAEAGAEAMMGVVLQNPELAPYEDVFRAWYRKVFATPEFESEMVKLYEETFSEGELRELAAFYRTPVGQRALTALPELMKKGAEVGLRRAQEHAAELEEMLEQAKQKRAGQSPGSDREAQKRTIADIRNAGTAMFSWLTDQVSAAAAGQPQTGAAAPGTSFRDYSPISYHDLEKLLVPNYMVRLAEKDGWGHPFEFYLNMEDPMAEHVIMIRSPGKDGRFSGGPYATGSFAPEDYGQDVVWADGYFVRWPEAPK